jgi:HPt (histidine-containing phosphotransfer) domain-containing protein
MMNSQISKLALRRLLGAIGGDLDDLEELREDYLGMTPILAQRLAYAHAQDDRETLRITAHEFKSNARDFGADALADLCEALERNTTAGTEIDQNAIDDILRAEEEARVSLANTDLSDV